MWGLVRNNFVAGLSDGMRSEPSGLEQYCWSVTGANNNIYMFVMD